MRMRDRRIGIHYSVSFDYEDVDESGNSQDFRDLLMEKFEHAVLENRMTNVVVVLNHQKMNGAADERTAPTPASPVCQTCFGTGYHNRFREGFPCPNGCKPPTAPETIESYFVRQSEWSARTFGHGTRTQGIIEHIGKELLEVQASPHDLEEWIDLIMLTMDGFWRHGGDPRDILKHLNAKQAKNFARKWNVPKDGHAVEHVREDAKPEQPPVTAQELRGCADFMHTVMGGSVGYENKLRALADWMERTR